MESKCFIQVFSFFYFLMPGHGCNLLQKADTSRENGRHILKEKRQAAQICQRQMKQGFHRPLRSCGKITSPVRCSCLDPTQGRIELYYCYEVCGDRVFTNNDQWLKCGCIAACPSPNGGESTKYCCPGHGSCPTTTTTTTTATTTPKPKPGCFPSRARVFLENGKSVTMSELEVGDRVQTATVDDDMTYSDVRVFLKKEHTMMTLYKTITTSSNRTVHLTENHLIYARKMCSEKFSAINANYVSIGDEVLVQEKDGLRPDKVINVSHSIMQGAYVPLTKEGNIVVDGILASCYPAKDHEIPHLVMTPILWFPEIIQLIFGEGNGTQTYVNLANDVGQWVLPYEQQNERN